MRLKRGGRGTLPPGESNLWFTRPLLLSFSFGGIRGQGTESRLPKPKFLFKLSSEQRIGIYF